MKVTLLVMALNEIDGMKEIMPQVNHDWVHQIIVVDGGSSDGTVEWAIDNGFQTYVQKKKGFRHAYEEVWPLIEGDVVITFSPDGNSVTQLIPDLVQKMSDGYDLVIASRYLEGAKSYDDDFITAFGNWLFTKTVNFLHGGSYTDVMVIYRAFRTELPKELGLFDQDAYILPERLFSTKISWEPLFSVRAAKAKVKTTEIPGDEPPRIGGDRKLQIIRWGAAYYFQFIREIWFWKPKK